MAEPISVVMNVLNGETTIGYALKSVLPWASEVIVVDQHSSDNTVKIAEELGAKVFFHPKTDGNVERARAYAIGLVTCPWIFVIDADEMVPAGLADWLSSSEAQSGPDIWRLPRQNYIWNRLMTGTGWNPENDHQTRYFKRGSVHLDTHIHRGIQPKAETAVKELAFSGRNAIIHFNYIDVEDFLERLNRYTTHEASAILEKGARSSNWRALRHAFHAFRRRYWKQGGRKEGWHGFYLSLMMGFYSLAVHAKVTEALENGTKDRVMESYSEISERILREYGIQ
jgi:glycosyltransferase involved in cell wall biosynthesis